MSWRQEGGYTASRDLKPTGLFGGNMFHSFCCQLASHMHISEEISRARDTQSCCPHKFLWFMNEIICPDIVYSYMVESLTIRSHASQRFIGAILRYTRTYNSSNIFTCFLKYTQQVDQLLS